MPGVFLTRGDRFFPGLSPEPGRRAGIGIKKASPAGEGEAGDAYFLLFNPDILKPE